MKFYFISPIGQKSYLLYDTFEQTFKAVGHEIVTDIEQADYVFYDLWCGWGEYDSNEMAVVKTKKLPVAVFDFFDFNDTVKWQGFTNFENVKKEWWAFWLIDLLNEGLVKAYFMRKMNKTLAYPDWVYPIECIQYPDHDFSITTPHEVFSRPNDICFIGTWSKERESVINGLLKGGLKVDYQFTTERIPHEEWLQRHRQSKCFLSADGGGYGDERPYQLITIAALVQQKNNHQQRQPFVDSYECIKISEIPTKEEIEHLKLKVSSLAEIWEMHISGIRRVHQYYNSEYRSKYLLEIIKRSTYDH